MNHFFPFACSAAAMDGMSVHRLVLTGRPDEAVKKIRAQDVAQPVLGLNRGCQMVYFETKSPNLGKFWRALEWKVLVYPIVIWKNLRPFDIVTLSSFGNVVIIWYVFPRFGILHSGTSGNRGLN
jgi:hypothetical protein